MNNFFRRQTLLLILILGSSLHLAAQSIEVEKVTISVVGGNTREKAVRRWIDVTEGAVYEDREALETAVQRDVQELLNLRVFLSVDSEISTGTAAGGITAEVRINIQDATTFVPVPLPLYDSNTGGVQLLYVQIWDNMFGTLTNWFSLATLVIRRGDDGKIETGPFIVAPQVSNIRVGDFVFGFRFEQERVESSRFDGNTLVADYKFDRSAFFMNTEFRFGANRRLYYTVEPGFEFRYGYEDYLGSGGYDVYPFGTQLYQSFYYDSVNAFGNSRKGFRTGISNTLKVIQTETNWKPVTDFRAEISPYLAFGKEGRVSYYARLMGLKVIGDVYDQLGEPMRGIPDATMDGDTALYLNQTVGIGVWRWKGVWDLQVHPFFDMGLAVGGSTSFEGWDSVRMSTGADILLFIEKVPNLAFRFSWGMDLNPDVSWEDDNKTEFIVRYAFSY